jgi:hypothetical protein
MAGSEPTTVLEPTEELPVTDQPVAPAPAPAPVPKKKGNGLLIAIIIILVVLILAVSGAAFWFLGGRDIIMDAMGIESVDERDVDKLTEEESEEEEGTESKETEATAEAVADRSVPSTESKPEPETETETEEEISEYILEFSDSKYLTEDDLEGFDADMCRIARNEIYARHGRMFDDEELQAYFDSLSWYEPKIPAADFEESMLNDYEMANRDLIVEYEKEMGYR